MFNKIKRLILVVLGLFILVPTISFAEKTKTIRVHSWLPPKHTMNANVLPTWGKWVEDATEGRVKLKVEYPGGSPKSVLDNVTDGAFEAGWTFHGFYPGRFKLQQIVELPQLGVGADKASIAYWDVYEKFLAKGNEHRGLHVAGLFTHAPCQMHLAKPIKSLSEMKGKKIRIGGGIQTTIAKNMGIEGIAAPGSKVYEILSQGVADGVFMPLGEKRTLRLKEVAPFTMKFPNGMYLGSFVVVMNKDFLAGLSEKDRMAVESVSGAKLSALAGKYWQEDADVGEADAIKSGNTILSAPDSVIAEFAALTKGMDTNWLETVKDSGVDAEAALTALRAAVK